MFSKYTIVAAFAGLAAAYHAPVGDAPSGNAITSPLNEAVPAGKPFTIKWQADSKNPVSLILLKGGSSNAVFNRVIVEAIPNSGSYTWNVPADLEASVGTGGYGIQLIDDVDGHYQYSTQIGIENDAPVESSAAPSVAPSSKEAAPSYTASAIAEAVSSAAGYEVSPVAPAPAESTDCTSTTTVYVTSGAPAPSAPAAGNPPYGTGVPPAAPYPTGTAAPIKPSGTGAYLTPSNPAEFEGSASSFKAGAGLVGAIAAFVAML